MSDKSEANPRTQAGIGWGEALRILFHSAGFTTQESVAKQLGTSVSMVSRWTRMTECPNLRHTTLNCFYELFGLTEKQVRNLPSIVATNPRDAVAIRPDKFRLVRDAAALAYMRRAWMSEETYRRAMDELSERAGARGDNGALPLSPP